MARAAVTDLIRLQAHPDGHYRFAVVSDTHSKAHPKAAERLRELAPDSILHGGDIGDLQVLTDLAQVAPVYAVRGNIDVQAPGVPDVLTLEVIAGTSMRLRILLTHIAVYGPKLRAEVAKRALATRTGLVVCGHSHVPFMGRDRGIGMFNPGSIGPRRFALPIVLGCIDLTASSVRLRHIDCETGADWLPPEVPRAKT
jgi:putative phosphoesterase